MRFFQTWKKRITSKKDPAPMECINKKYPLGPKYRGIVLNYREAMCMHYLLKKWKLSQIAKQMQLSTRTISFYISSVMLQLKCDSLSKLIDCIKDSELMKYFDKKNQYIS